MKGLRTDWAHVAGSLWNLSVHHQQKLLKEPSKCGQCLAHTACNRPVNKCFQLASTNQLVPISRSRAFHVEASTKGPDARSLNSPILCLQYSTGTFAYARPCQQDLVCPGNIHGAKLAMQTNFLALFALYRFEHRVCNDNGTEDSQVKRLLQPSVPRGL